MTEWIKVTTIDVNPPKARATLLHLKHQVDIARMQFQRLREDSSKIDQLHKLQDQYKEQMTNLTGMEREEIWKKVIEKDWGWRDQFALLYADAQFLIIILARVYRLLEKLRLHLSTHRPLNEARKKYRKWLEEYDEFRDDIEHMDEKIEKEMVDLDSHIIGIGYEFVMKRQGVEINDNTEKQLDNLMHDLIRALDAKKDD